MYNTQTTHAEVLRKLLTEKGMTINALVKASEISESTVKKVLRNVQEPRLYTLYCLLTALNTTMEEYYFLLHGTDMAQFNSDFAHLIDVGFGRKSQKMSIKLDELKTKPYCNLRIPYIRQAILLADAIIAIGKDNDYDTGLALYYEALSITISSKILTKSNELKYSDIAKYKLSMNEYRILRGIAVAFEEQKDTQKATDIYSAILSSLESDTANYEIQKKQLPIVYFNLSNALIDSEQYVNALDIVNKGIDLCLKTKELKMMAYLLWNKGKSTFFLDNKKLASEFFQHAYKYFKDMEDEGMLEGLRTTAKTKYDVLLQ